MDRRTFIQTGTLASMALAGVPALAQPAADNRTLRVGVVGCGWYGMVDLRNILLMGEPARVVSLCDVDRRMLSEAADEIEARQGQRPRTYGDYREMLRERDLDIVVIGTPDHWHALPAIAAMEAGADVYLEKPICHTYGEGKAMLATARRLRRVVQVNTQRRSTPHILRAREFIREGHLGTVGFVRAYCYFNMRGNDRVPNAPVPDYLDWDMYCGPSPVVPYNPSIHPRRWRRFNEFGNGILGDMGIHMLDTMRFLLGVRWPRRISSTGGIFVERDGLANITDTQTVLYDYGNFTAVWEHRTFGRADDPRAGWGLNIVGERGTLQVTIDGFEFLPHRGGEALRVEATRLIDPTRFESERVVPAGRAHALDFIRCVQTRERPIADIEEGHISTALCLLGNIALQVGRTLTWDAEREQCVGDDEANRLLRRTYRAPWVYPEA